MIEDIFYHYDFYTLEQKYTENEFIKILDNEPLLNSLTESFLQNVVALLLKSIEEKQNIEISSIALPKIEEYLQNILKSNSLYELTSKNNLSEVVINKFLSRIFKRDGFNGVNDIVHNYIHSWLEKKLALEIFKDSRFNSVDILISVIKKTEMLHGFQIYFTNNIPNDWIQNNKKDWVNITVNPVNILDSISTFEKEYFNNYIDLFISTDKTNLWDFTKVVTHGSDYAMLNDEYSFRSSVLIKNDILLWIEFWDNLKFPIIQDCAFHSFNFKPQQYLQLLNALVSKKIKVESDLNVLLLIVIKKFFDASYKLTERLSFYEEEDRIKTDNKHFFKEGQKYYKEWLEEKPNHYKELIENLQTQLDNSDIENWIFSYKLRIESSYVNKTKLNEMYNSEIKLLTSLYKSYCNQLVDFDLKSFNLQKFNFYVEIVRDSDDKLLTENLLEAIFNFIESDKFYWDKSFSEPYWSCFKGMGYLISLHSDSIQKSKELIEKFKINHQGWKPIKIDFKPLIKESFIFSGIVFIFEHSSAFRSDQAKVHFFKELLNTILIQDKYSQIDNYQQPLNLLFWVANKVFLDVKEYFEIELIENYDNLYSLLSILSSDEKTICCKSKKIMKERLDREFFIEKRQFSNRSQNNKILELEKMIEILEIDY